MRAVRRDRDPAAGEAVDDGRTAFERLASVLAAVDGLRREAEGEAATIAAVYLEGARGALQHAREALVLARVGVGVRRSVRLPGGTVGMATGDRMFAADLPEGWVDDVAPGSPDLGADLLACDAARDLAGGRYLGGMLEAALADHAWLNLATGVVWSSDRGGAAALVGAMSGGRPVERYDWIDTAGALEERVVRFLAGLGWRRFRSPRYAPGGPDACG